MGRITAQEALTIGQQGTQNFLNFLTFMTNLRNQAITQQQQANDKRQERLIRILGHFKDQPEVANAILAQFPELQGIEIKPQPEETVPVPVKKPKEKTKTHPITGREIKETELTETGTKMIPGIMDVKARQIRGLPTPIQEMILSATAQKQGFAMPEVPLKPTKPERGVLDWEYKENKKRRVLRNPVTGELIWASPDWISGKEKEKPIAPYTVQQKIDDIRLLYNTKLQVLTRKYAQETQGFLFIPPDIKELYEAEANRIMEDRDEDIRLVIRGKQPKIYTEKAKEILPGIRRIKRWNKKTKSWDTVPEPIR